MTEKKEELRQLLNEAMENIVIDSPEGYEPISIDTYKKQLQSLRKHHRPDLRSRMSFYYIDIQNEAIKSNLLDFIKGQFKDFINEELNVIQPANYGIGNGGSVSGQEVEALLTKLLQIAIASGKQRAIVAFEKSITETKGSFQRIVLLQGLGTHPKDSGKLTEIQICKGVRLVFLPYDPEKLPPYLFDYGFSSLFFQSNPGIFMRKAIIVIDCEVSPLFCKPEFDAPTVHSDGSRSYSPKKDAYSFQKTIRSTEFPEFDVDQFCRAISLTCNFACVSILDWGHIDPDELFSVRGHGIVPTARCVLPNEPVGFGRILEDQIPKIKRLYEALVNLDSDTRGKLQIAIDRWIKSKAGDNPVDKMIDLGIAFESLYLSDTDAKTEVTLRFRLHASWHLGKDKKHRKDLMKEFGEIYNWRSTVVHTGKLPKKELSKRKKRPFTPEEIKEFIKKAQDLCQKSIMKILEEQKFPNWSSLILG